MPQKLIQHSLGFSRESRMDSIMRSSKHIMFSTRTKNQHVSNLLEFERKKIGVDENLVLIQTNRSIANERDSLSKILALQKIYQRHSFDKYDPVLHPQKRNRLCHMDARDLMKLWFKGKNVRTEKAESVSQSLTDSRPVSSIFKRMRMTSGRSRKMSSVSGEGGVWGNLITETIQEEPKDNDIDSLLEGDDTEGVVNRLDDEQIHIVPAATSKVDRIQVNTYSIKDGKPQHKTSNTEVAENHTYKKNHESNAFITDQHNDISVKTKSDAEEKENKNDKLSKVTPRDSFIKNATETEPVEKDSSIKTAAETVPLETVLLIKPAAETVQIEIVSSIKTAAETKPVERDSSIKSATETVPIERDSSIKAANLTIPEERDSLIKPVVETLTVAGDFRTKTINSSGGNNSATTNVQRESLIRKPELRKSAESNEIPKCTDQNTSTIVQNKNHGNSNDNNVNHTTKKNEKNKEQESTEISKNPQSAKRLNSQKCESDVEKSITKTTHFIHREKSSKLNVSKAIDKSQSSKVAENNKNQKIQDSKISIDKRPDNQNILNEKPKISKEKTNLSSVSTQPNTSKSASLRHSIQKVESVTMSPNENIVSLKNNRTKQSNNYTTNKGAIPLTTAPCILKKAKIEMGSWRNVTSASYDARRSSSASTLKVDNTLIHNAATNNPANWKNLIHRLKVQKDEVIIDDRVVAAKSTRRLKRREKTFVLSRERTIFPGQCKSTYEMRRFIEREVSDLMFSLSPKGRRQSRIELLKERESNSFLPSLVNQSKTTSAILRDFRKYYGNNRTATAP